MTKSKAEQLLQLLCHTVKIEPLLRSCQGVSDSVTWVRKCQKKSLKIKDSSDWMGASF